VRLVRRCQEVYKFTKRSFPKIVNFYWHLLPRYVLGEPLLAAKNYSSRRDEGNRRNDRKDSGDEITFIPEFFPSFVFFAL